MKRHYGMRLVKKSCYNQKTWIYNNIGSEVKKQTDIVEKQYQGLVKDFSSNKDNKNVNKSLIKKEDIDKEKI